LVGEDIPRLSAAWSTLTAFAFSFVRLSPTTLYFDAVDRRYASSPP
jgi:hypothetical protein